jgi:hypothetical protein
LFFIYFQLIFIVYFILFYYFIIFIFLILLILILNFFNSASPHSIPKIFFCKKKRMYDQSTEKNIDFEEDCKKILIFFLLQFTKFLADNTDSFDTESNNNFFIIFLYFFIFFYYFS